MNSLFNTVGTAVTESTFRAQMDTAGLNWSVTKRPIYCVDDDDVMCPSTQFYGIMRDDNKRILGVVGKDYTPLQNEELFYLCERLQPQGVKVETAGALEGGARVWIQMAGDPMGIGTAQDEVVPYFVMTNGHNGMYPLAGLPTTYRVICQNTLNLAIRNGKKNGTMISIRHHGNISDRLESMIDAVENFKDRTAKFYTRAESLARKDVTTDFVQKFWTDVYVNMFGDIHNTTETAAQESDNKTAASTMTKWCDIFDLESRNSGTNLWTAYNAVSYWLDHSQTYRGNNKTENRFTDTLFGTGAKEKLEVFDIALAYS